MESRAAYQPWDTDEGRFDRGLRLTGKSWQLVRANPRLTVLPAAAAFSMTVAGVLLFDPALYALRHAGWKLSLVVALAALMVPMTFITTYFNVAFLAAVNDHLEGREASVRGGLRAANARIWTILGWSILSASVGALLSVLENVRGADIATKVFAFVADLAWGLATFFVVPVLALERVSVPAAVKRSAQTFRAQWGESVTGDLAIGFIFGLAMIPGLVVGYAAYHYLHGGHVETGLILGAIAVVLLVPVMVASSAVSELFTLVVYRDAVGRGLTPPFNEYDLRTAFKPRATPSFWQRLRRRR